jgi:hypothetical protein
MTGRPQPHRLETLGYTRIRRASDGRRGAMLKTLHRQGTLIVRIVTRKICRLSFILLINISLLAIGWDADSSGPDDRDTWPKNVRRESSRIDLH